MRTASQQTQQPSHTPAPRESSRSTTDFSRVDFSRHAARSAPSFGNQAMLRRLSRVAPAIQRKCSTCEEDEHALHKKDAAGAPSSATEAPPSVHRALNTPGQPLDTATRAFFEPRFGVALNSVRVHQDALAAESAQSINALAYAVGNDIVFGAGRYQPQSKQGKTLLAHELAHTLQQKGDRVQRVGEPGPVADPVKDQAEEQQGKPPAAAKLAARPTSNAFWGAYMQVSYMNFQQNDVWMFIGGSVAKIFHKENSCATRMSYALNRAGLPIPKTDYKVRYYNDPAVKWAYKAGDGLNYIVGAPAMDEFLKSQIGPPDQKITTVDQLKAFQGTLAQDQVALFACVGHTGMLKGGYQDPYVETELPIDVWKLP